MSNLLSILQRTPMYAALLEQVPEANRGAALKELESQLQPYEALLAALPPGSVDSFLSGLNGDAPPDPSASNQRPPRRF
jgi:hypothetical protein